MSTRFYTFPKRHWLNILIIWFSCKHLPVRSLFAISSHLWLILLPVKLVCLSILRLPMNEKSIHMLIRDNM